MSNRCEKFTFLQIWQGSFSQNSYQVKVALMKNSSDVSKCNGQRGMMNCLKIQLLNERMIIEFVGEILLKQFRRLILQN